MPALSPPLPRSTARRSACEKWTILGEIAKADPEKLGLTGSAAPVAARDVAGAASSRTGMKVLDAGRGSSLSP